MKKTIRVLAVATLFLSVPGLLLGRTETTGNKKPLPGSRCTIQEPMHQLEGCSAPEARSVS